MRFIIRELPYERPLLAGRLRYERDGVPTGAVESWRLTQALDDYRFLRVDLDAREAPSGRSSLFHVTLNPAGRPEQIKYRLWGNGPEVSGTAVWEGNEVIAARRVDGCGDEVPQLRQQRQLGRHRVDPRAVAAPELQPARAVDAQRRAALRAEVPAAEDHLPPGRRQRGWR